MKLLKVVTLALALASSAPAWSVGSLADLNVYDRSEGRRLQVYWHEGKAWVVGKPGNEYQVSLRNREGGEVLAVVSVDGINVITGETASPQQTGYILSPRGGFDIQGWRKSSSETAAFYFTTLPDSYAARTGRPDNVGVIGVALYRKKQEVPIAPIAPLGQSAPSPLSEMGPMFGRRSRDDTAAPASKAAEAQLGTGHGRRETSYVRNVQFERATSAPAETVTLYYDSHRNLVARGVIREPAPFQPSPRPFPGFVPDPYS
jgi:hypothetical protein